MTKWHLMYSGYLWLYALRSSSRTSTFPTRSDLAHLMLLSHHSFHHIYEHVMIIKLTTSKCYKDDPKSHHVAKRIQEKIHKKPNANLFILAEHSVIRSSSPNGSPNPRSIIHRTSQPARCQSLTFSPPEQTIVPRRTNSNPATSPRHDGRTFAERRDDRACEKAVSNSINLPAHSGREVLSSFLSNTALTKGGSVVPYSDATEGK